MKISVTVTVDQDSAQSKPTFLLGDDRAVVQSDDTAMDLYLAIMSEFHRKRTQAMRSLCLRTTRGLSCSLVAGHVGECDADAVVSVR